MSELKPCPFCGGEAELKEWVGNGFTAARVTWGKVGCPSCNIWTADIQPSGGYNSPYVHDRAIAAWNSRPVDGWQPIETAPKDGTVIDVWRDGSRDTVYWGLPPHECGEMGEYCDSDWHGMKEPGWICVTFGEFVGGKHNPFSHWMPLPKAADHG